MQITKIKLKNQTYSISDETARSSIQDISTQVSNLQHNYTNVTYTDKLFVCGNNVSGYQTFKEVSNMPQGTVANIKAGYTEYVFTVSGKPYWLSALPFNASVVDVSKNTLTTVTCMATSKTVIASIEGGKLYVVGSDHLSASATNTQCGSLLGDTLVPSKTEWTQVGSDSDWFYVNAHNGTWVALKGDGTKGTLYVAGYNYCKVLGTAALDDNGDPIFTKNYSSNSVNTYLLNTLTPITILENNVRITPNDWVKVCNGQSNILAQRENGKLYVWGASKCGCLGNGTNYWPDISDAQISQETNGAITSIIQEGVSQPQVVTVREYDDDYDEETNPNAYTDVEYDDWIDFSHDWYHCVALRKNDQNESQVYLWGSNEYGQFGNGYYYQTGLYVSNSGSESKNIQIKNRPWKLTSDLFPYTDVNKVLATHYGTFLFRSNGQVYFAGSNKRNYLGIYSNNSGASTFIPYFTKINVLGDLYCETYGALTLRQIPYFTSNADSLITSVFSNALTVDNLFDAVSEKHHHSINPSLIDDTVTSLYNYVATIPQTVQLKHAHTNSSTLNKLTDSNGVLLLDGNPISSGTSDGGTYVETDPSNVKLDDLSDVVGLNNLSGGFPLQVVSYFGDSTNDKGYIAVTQTGTQFHNKDRFPSIYLKSGTTYTSKIDASILRKGCWGIVFTTSAKTASYSSRFIGSATDFYNFIVDVNKSTNYVGVLYDLTAINGSDNTTWSDGTILVNSITKSSYPTASLYCKQDNNDKLSDEYTLLSNYSFGGNGTHTSEQTKWMDIYSSNGTLLVAESVFDNPVYDENGTLLQFVAQMIIPASYTVSGNQTVAVYHSYYDNNTASGTAIITGQQIANGIYKKQASSYNKIGLQDGVESFDQDLFTVGDDIYLAPSMNDYNGTANHKYTIEKIYPCTTTTSSSSTSSTTLDYMLLKINKAIINDEQSTVTYYPGSVTDPMLAVVKSQYRPYTSQVSGQYNASVGYNATTFGNGNKTFGDFSVTFGLQNVNCGSLSFAIGTSNSICSDNSYICGVSNKIVGQDTFVYGSGNYITGYYTFVVGTMNYSEGVSNVILGYNNKLKGGRCLVFGARNTTTTTTNDSLILGSNLQLDAKNAIVVGANGQIAQYEGNFPTTDVASSLSSFDTSTYDSSGLHNKNSFRICMGDKITSTENKALDILVYNKYKWQVNNEYFATATSSRSSLQPMIISTDHTWTFTGKVYVRLATNDDQDTFRNAGRVKTFDAGMQITDALTDLDFDKASKFKIKVSGSYTPTLTNWTDGSQGTIIVYGGTDISWPTTNWYWVNNTQPSSVSTSESTTFALVKIMVVDSKIIAESIGTF